MHERLNQLLELANVHSCKVPISVMLGSDTLKMNSHMYMMQMPLSLKEMRRCRGLCERGRERDPQATCKCIVIKETLALGPMLFFKQMRDIITSTAPHLHLHFTLLYKFFMSNSLIRGTIPIARLYSILRQKRHRSSVLYWLERMSLCTRIWIWGNFWKYRLRTHFKY